MRLWVDEDLVAVAHAAGCETTCVRDRGRLSSTDRALARVVLDEEWVLVTNNSGDFLASARRPFERPGW